MAAVKLKEGKEFDCVTTCSVLANYLPVYARPRFIRIQVHHLTFIQYIPTDLASRRRPLQSQLHTVILSKGKFIFQNSLEITGTFKMKKVKLVEEGFDPTLIQDPLYFLDLTQKKYIPLSQEIHNSIMSHNIKL